MNHLFTLKTTKICLNSSLRMHLVVHVLLIVTSNWQGPGCGVGGGGGGGWGGCRGSGVHLRRHWSGHQLITEHTPSLTHWQQENPERTQKLHTESGMEPTTFFFFFLWNWCGCHGITALLNLDGRSQQGAAFGIICHVALFRSQENKQQLQT